MTTQVLLERFRPKDGRHIYPESFTMGLLAVGTPLEWPEAKKVAGHVREWGIEQLLAIWNRSKGKERDKLLWGDEVW